MRIAASEFRILPLDATSVADQDLALIKANTQVDFYRENDVLWIVADINPVAKAVEPLAVEPLGVWHAIIASYPPTPKGCSLAKDDIAEFGRLLSGSAAAGLPLYIARTAQSPVYVVTVDIADDALKAREIVAVIRNVAQKSADRRTGADSFVLSNNGWTIDPTCRSSLLIKVGD